MTYRRNKYGAKKTLCALGHRHDSKHEAKRCAELQLLFRAGQIDMLVFEPQYWFEIGGTVVKHPNGRRVGYKPDFGYREGDAIIVEDVKSKATITEASRLRMTLFEHLFPNIQLRIVQ